MRNEVVEPLRIEPRKDTPLVEFDPGTALFRIQGRSHPEDPTKFWLPLLRWTERYIVKARGDLTAEIDLNYFNTSSCKCLLDFLSILEGYHGNESRVLIKWLYKEDDEETLEAGEDLAEDVDVEFEFIIKDAAR